MNQYSSLSHSILPLMYKIVLGGQFTYILKAQSVKSLVLLNPKPYQLMKHHIDNIQKLADCKLTHVLSQEGPHNSQLVGSIPTTIKVYTPDEAGSFVGKDLVPFSIGELSVCYLEWRGLKKDKSVICITHMTQQSTKLPAIFPGKIFGVCSVDEKDIASKTQYLKSLEKIRNFPEQSLIFPGAKVDKTDLEFALALDPQSSILTNKLQMFNALKEDDRLVPTTLIEQKNSNPYFRPGHYSELFKSSSKIDNFSKLLKLRQAYRKQ